MAKPKNNNGNESKGKLTVEKSKKYSNVSEGKSLNRSSGSNDDISTKNQQNGQGNLHNGKSIYQLISETYKHQETPHCIHITVQEGGMQIHDAQAVSFDEYDESGNDYLETENFCTAKRNPFLEEQKDFVTLQLNACREQLLKSVAVENEFIRNIFGKHFGLQMPRYGIYRKYLFLKFF